MDFIEDPIDQGAPEYNVTGIASIERISVGQVRVTKYARRKGENFITHHEVWDLLAWLHDRSLNEEVRDIISRAPPDTQSAEQRRERH